MFPRTVFVHGRPGPHPFHATLARSVDADFLPVDFRMRWHDRPTSQPYRYLSWAVCALSFPHRRQYDLFLTEGPHFPPLMMRRLGILRHGQRVAALMANETLYFLKTAHYPKTTERMLTYALKAYDALICVGKMQASLAREMTSGYKRAPAIYTVPNCVPDYRVQELDAAMPDLRSQRIVFIGNGCPGWRGHYKGIDLTIEAAAQAACEIDGLSLSIIGEWPPEFLQEYSRGFADPNRVVYHGRVNDLGPVLSGASLYLHLGRGDAFPTSVLEAMAAGLPAMVSEWTGAREVVDRVDPRLIVPLAAHVAAERIKWYYRLPLEDKQKLSQRARMIARDYTQRRSTQAFRDAIIEVGP